MNSNHTLRKILGWGILLLLLTLIPLAGQDPYLLHILILVGINIMLASSLRLIALAGQISLAHGGMMGVGAYTSVLLVMKLGFSYWLALPLAGVASALLALLVGYPFVKLKGIYFSMVTIFLAEMIILTTEQWRGLTGGTSGIINIPRPGPLVIPGLLHLDFSSKLSFYFLLLLLIFLSLLILYALEHSRIGLTWQTIQQSHFLAESVGIHTIRYQVLAFAIGGFFAGIVGSFYGHYMSIISPRSFGFFFAINVLVYMVVGGTGRFSGPIFGASLLTSLPEVFRPLKEYQPFIFAGVMMFVIFFLPEGLVGLPRRIAELFGERFRRA